MARRPDVATIGKNLWRSTRHIGHRIGVDVRRWPIRDPNPESLDAKLRVLFAARSIDCVIDVGAHQGEFARRLRGLPRYFGEIISIEPSTESYEALVAECSADPNWHAVNLALGSEQGMARLHRVGSSNLNSLHSPSELGRSQLDMEQTSFETVTVRRLDDLHIAGKALLLKSDTQGHDIQVLDGATKLLARTQAVLVETAIRPLYEGAPLLADLLDYMVERSFEIAGLYPVLTDSDGVREIEFDALFVTAHADDT